MVRPAGPGSGQADEADLGLAYADLDDYLEGREVAEGRGPGDRGPVRRNRAQAADAAVDVRRLVGAVAPPGRRPPDRGMIRRCGSTASTTSPRSPATPRGTSTSTRGVLGLRMVDEDRQPGRPDRLPPVLRRRAGSAGLRPHVLRVPGRRARPRRRRDGAPRSSGAWASTAALDFWADRLDRGVAATARTTAVGFADPEGLEHELRVSTASDDEPLTARHPEIPPEHALQGFEGVRACSRRPDAHATPCSSRLLERRARAATATWELRGERRGGSTIALRRRAARARACRAPGTVHHVAWDTTIAEHPSWQRARSSAAGVRTSGIVDRHYFHSIYFLEPGGVLFEIATTGPGSPVDQALEELGRR